MNKKICITILAGVLLTWFCGTVYCYGAADDYVWWEGEATVETNFPEESWFSAGTFPERRDQLSGGRWLSNSGPRSGPEAYAHYRVDIPAPGEYDFWTRKFWKHGPFKWRFGEGAWQTCGRDVALADSVDLKLHVCANWVHLGRVSLDKNETTFELRLLANQGEELTAAFDCFLLTRSPFTPAGKLKPGQKSGKTEPGCFAWEPPADPFTDDALLDLRHLNENQAGDTGFITKNGDFFTLGNGRKVRFWAVNVGPNIADQPHALIDYMAAKLAKLGVNGVRYHGPIFAADGNPAQVDRQRLDNIHYLVHALKKQGIYTSLSFYFPLWFDVKPHYGIAGYEQTENKIPFTLLFFEPRMQQIYKSWAKALLTTNNPYTGRPLNSEPAVAMVEIQNEDSLFFWTFTEQNIPSPHLERLEKLFGAWAAKKYGSVQNAIDAWKSQHERDNPANGRAGLHSAWFMTRDGVQNAREKTKRLQHQVRFLCELQHGFYQDMTDYFKSELGLRSLVVAGNWKTADALMLDAIERYTYTAGDVMDRHGYFSGPHSGDGAGYSVRKGHTCSDLAAVHVPWRTPVQEVLVTGYPQIISEIGWPNPNRFRADMTLIASAYASLQGIDGLFFFCVDNCFINDTSLAKFTTTSPVTAGAFPAAALAYRRGDIREAEIVFLDAVGKTRLLDMKPETAASAEAFDELRKKDIPDNARTAGLEHGFDPLAFFAGKVQRSYENSVTTSAADLTRFINRQREIVTSKTGELQWNYGDGLVTVNTPRCKGATGFLQNAGAIELGGVTIDCKNEYASVMVIALDDKNIESSQKILIQILTEEKPYGFRAENGRIVDLGEAPFQIIKMALTLTLPASSNSTRMYELDENGYPQKSQTIKPQNGILTIQTAPNAMYTIIDRKG